MRYLLTLFFLSLILFASELPKDGTSFDEYSFKDGERIYNETCISCHGKSGETNNEMKLVVKPRKLNKTILNMEQSYQIIKNGAHYFGAHSDIMPSWKKKYDDKTLKSVAHYINEIIKNKP